MKAAVLGCAAVLILTTSAGAAAQPAADEPSPPTGAAPAEPAAPAAPAAAVSAPAPERATYAVGSRIRMLMVPAWFIEAFMRHAHSLNSFSWGADFTRRKGNLDIVIGLDVGWYGNFKDANWTGNDDTGYPGDTYWTEFRKFVFTSIDINWIWHHDLTPWLAFRAGGGIGIGFLGGNYYKTQSGPSCSASNVDSDLANCGPIGQRQAEDLSSYRVLPVVSALLGFRFKVHRHFVAAVEGGFHNAFFWGVNGQYVF